MKNITPPKISSSRNKLSSKNNPLDTAANLAEKRLKAGIEHNDPYNSLIGDVAGQFHDKLKGSANDFDSVASGFFEGIQNVTKFNKMFENDKKYKEYQGVLNYFQEVNNEKLKQQQYHDKLENAQEQLRPMALAYFGNQKKDPQSAFISGQKMWNKYAELTGDTGKFLGWTPLDQNIAMIEHDGEVELLDIRPLLLGDQYSENQIAALDQDYQNKIQDERLENQRKYELEERKVGNQDRLTSAQIQKINSDIEHNPTRIDNSVLRNEIAAKNYELKKEQFETKHADILIPQIESYQRFNKIADRAKEVINRNPGILNSLTSVAWKRIDEPGYLDTAVKNFAQTIDSQGADDYSILLKYIAQMKTARIGKLVRPNMFMDKLVSENLPNEQMTSKSFLKALNELQEETIDGLSLSKKRLGEVSKRYSALVDDEESMTTSIPGNSAAKNLSTEELKRMRMEQIKTMYSPQ